ncbi:MAG: hypothetical protein U0836_00860 [Pirellulales bacterium]
MGKKWEQGYASRLAGMRRTRMVTPTPRGFDGIGNGRGEEWSNRRATSTISEKDPSHAAFH